MSDHPHSGNSTISPNGAIPRLAKRIEWVTMPDYPGLEAGIWANPPNRIPIQLGRGNEEQKREALRLLVVKVRTVTEGQTYPYWFDGDGKPLSEEISEDWIDAIPLELVASLFILIQKETSKLPNWLTAPSVSTAGGSAPASTDKG